MAFASISKVRVLIASLIIFTLNEFIYYYEAPSYLINVLLFSILIYKFLIKSDDFLYSMIIFCLVLNTRPRELHKISIDMRGMFDYYTFNMQKFGAFSFSTTLLIIISFVMIIMVLTNRLSGYGLKIPILVSILSIIMTLIYALDTQGFAISRGTLSIRYLLLIIGGFLFYQYYIKDKLVKNPLFIDRIIINVLATSTIVSLLNLTMDVFTGDFKLRYTTSTIYFAAMIFYVAIGKNFSNITRFTIPMISIIFLFPITRGEQLILFMSFFLYALLILYKNDNRNFGRYFSSKATLLLSVAGLFIALNYISINLPDTWLMLTQKFAFFTSTNLNLDQSSSVRTEEYIAIFDISSIRSFLYIFFGKGWLGTFSLPEGMVYALTQADFPLNDIANNEFYSPHGFIGYHILKFGFIGTFMLMFFLISKVRISLNKNHELNELSLLMMPSILYIGYFSPSYLFISVAILTSCMKLNDKDHIL